MRVVERVLMNNSPSNIFLNTAFSERYHQNYQAVLAALTKVDNCARMFACQDCRIGRLPAFRFSRALHNKL